jgi:hypothetical protein
VITLSCVLTVSRNASIYSHDMDDCAPTAQGISVDSVEEHLRDGLKEVLGFLDDQAESRRKLTRSGSHSPSAIPYNLSCAVPATAKSFGVVMHPILPRQLGQTPGRIGARVHSRYEWLGFGLELGGRGQTGNNWFEKVWSKSDHQN